VEVGRERRVVLGLGSNLGDRAGYLDAAARLLAGTPGLRLIGRARTYASPPAGGPPQGDYLNSAVLVATALAMPAVLARALEVEASLGRSRVAGERNAPRTIDIDVLWADGATVEQPGLEVPHPRLSSRAFALLPLLDLVPEAADPATGVAYASLPATRDPATRAVG
jgi:2-amino-4-hydroxy-6-hydroxymethyldihydropteridine diphosphokinase